MPTTSSSGLQAAKLTKKYLLFLPRGAKIMNFSTKATARDCDICGHTPETREPKPGYPTVSEEMRLMRVRLPEGVKGSDVNIGRSDFTVTGNVIELNVCNDTTNCRDRAAELKNPDGSPRYDPAALRHFR